MVKAKKALGQHFLKEEGIALKIVEALQIPEDNENNLQVPVLEIGPGTGVLTKYLLKKENIDLKLIEIDSESVEYLNVNYPELGERLVSGDFLKTDISVFFQEPFYVIGNFPYNISSQIFFKILENREMTPQIVCMLQREVARRLASPPGNKDYGILSVLLQAWYDIEYLFTVEEGAFIPPPKVKSAVIRLKQNGRKSLDCDESKFKLLVKTAFNQRRKIMRNSLKSLFGEQVPDHKLLMMRPEQLSVEDFTELTKLLTSN
jgi:16S rRNA (adenine1518-N6/adenine1519-N6)-dimethyltransferase